MNPYSRTQVKADLQQEVWWKGKEKHFGQMRVIDLSSRIKALQYKFPNNRWFL